MSTEQIFYVAIDDAQTRELKSNGRAGRKVSDIDSNITLMKTFLEKKGATFQGWKTDTEGTPSYGDALISMTPETARIIAKQPFVAQIPVAGAGAMVWPAEDVTISTGKDPAPGLTA